VTPNGVRHYRGARGKSRLGRLCQTSAPPGDGAMVAEPRIPRLAPCGVSKYAYADVLDDARGQAGALGANALGGAALLVFAFWLGGRLGPLAVVGSGDPLTGGTWLPTPVPAEAYIGGAVARPGLYPLAPNARLATLLRQAGGASRDADLARLNPARPVHDGETIAIPHRRHGACARD